MDMSGSEHIDAPVEAVWRALNDPEILRQAIPGCESLEKGEDGSLSAKVVLKIGPIKARFEGLVTLEMADQPYAYRISGEGKGGIAGFAKGGADVVLTEDGEGATLLSYTARAEVGGKIAQLGSRLIDSTAKKLAGEFFAKFGTLVAEPA